VIWINVLSVPNSLLLFPPHRHQADLLAPQLDLELIAGLQPQHGGIGLAHHEIAVELHPRCVAELAARLAETPAAFPEADPFGLQQRLIEGREVQTVSAIL
jgi:hypothetical protein